MPHRFQSHHAARLLDPERRQVQDPEELLGLLGTGPGDTVIDLGCGPGFLTLPAARRVGDAGLVLALDLSVRMLRLVAAGAQAAGLRNVVPVRTGAVRLPFETEVADGALMVNVLHELPNPLATLRHLHTILRPGGRLLVEDFREDQNEPGPPQSERLSQERILELAADAGFHLIGQPRTAKFHRAYVLGRP